MEVPAWLSRAATQHPERLALETPRGSLSYAELARRSSGAATALSARGVEAEGRVALLLEADEHFVVALHACLAIGAVAMPIDLRLGEEERRGQAASAAVVVDAPIGEDGPVEALAVATHHLSAPAIAVHTSGTAGASKTVELTYGNLLWSAMGSAVALGLDRGERWLCPLPLSHVGGLSVLVRSAVYGTTAVLHPHFDAEAVARALDEDDITLVSLVPTMVARLLDAGLRRPPALRHALIGGAGLAPTLAARAREAALPVTETYGLTEAASQVATDGVPLFCTQVEIAGDGEIVVSGPTVAPSAAGPDGLLRTGDLGALDQNGRLAVTGRKADTIVTGGENVAPGEVEAVLLEHPAVAEVAVHGRADPEWGQAITATVVLEPGARVSGQDLRAHAAGRLARYKVPKAVEFTEALPRTASGKILRRALR